MRNTFSVLSALAALAIPALGHAQQQTDQAGLGSDNAPAPDAHRSGVLLGGKVGGVLPFGGLSPNVRAGIELGYVFPWLNGSFGAALDLDFTAPKSSGTKSGDMRVTGGNYDWHLTEQEFAIMPVVMYRLTSLGSVTPYIGIGPRIFMLRSTVRGTAGGSEIAETTEQSTKVGVGIPLGADLRLGPGAVLAELLFEYGSLDHTATGDTNTGGLNLFLGYRFIL